MGRKSRKNAAMKISLFKTAYERQPLEDVVFDQYLEDVRAGKWQDVVLAVRVAKGQNISKEQYQKIKAQAPAVTASGTFSFRNVGNIVEHSGFIAIDLDAQDNQDGIPLDELAADPYTYAIHRSIGGDGVVVYVRIDGAKHLDAYLGLEEYYANKYRVIADKSCKDVTRLRYVSWDADMVINKNAKIFKAYIPKKKQEPVNIAYTQTRGDIDFIVQQIATNRVNLVESYHDWIKVGFAIAGEYGEAGRSAFHSISSQSAKYDPNACDKKYTQLLKSNYSKVGIGSLVWMAQQAGVQTKTERTLAIEGIAKLRKAQVGQNGGYRTKEDAKAATVDFLAKMEGIEGEDVAQVVDAVMAMESDQLKTSLTGDVITDAENYLKSLNLRRNKVTQAVELEGEPINDFIANSLYMRAVKITKETAKGKILGKDLFNTMLDSDIVREYHPFTDFFQNYAAMKPSGLIDQLLDCLILDQSYTEAQKERMKYFAGKWLVSIIASMHGQYSILCLVLTGAMGKGKTKFFRSLLPEDLARYYGESKLDRDKDDEVLMTQKLILLDDEFGGKSKQDAKRMRELLAKQWFNVRTAYARRHTDLLRIAVLCGTSNERDVLNDLEGNRRIIPVNITRVDFDKYDAIDKTMLFIELYYVYIKFGNDAWRLTEEEIEELNALTTSNEEACAELEAFFMLFRKPEQFDQIEHLTNTEIRSEIEAATKLRISGKRLGAALKRAGIAPISKRFGSTPIQVYPVVRLKQSYYGG